MRRGSILQLVVLSLLFGAAASAAAIFIPWLPESAADERDRIDFVFWFTTWICVFVFAVVAAITVYSLWKFRAPPDDDEDGPPVHGHTGVEIVWTAVPAALVTAISIVSAVALAQNERVPEGSRTIHVVGQQFAWSFKYDGKPEVTSGVLRLKLNEPVVLSITSRDVIHSFWVPEFGQKQDAVPGAFNRLRITPTKVGTFPVICTELCGLGHAIMRSRAVVMRPAAFDAWLREQRQALGGEGGGAARPAEVGKTVFSTQGCASCHTFTPAGAEGKVGPSLDNLAAAAERAGRPTEEYVRESIVNPNAVIASGYQAGVMPAFDNLPKEQLDALVEYLVEGSKGGQ